EPDAGVDAFRGPQHGGEEPAEAYGEEEPAAEELAAAEPAYGEEEPAAEEPAVDEPAAFAEDEAPAAEEPSSVDEAEPAADDAWGSDEAAFDDEATVVSDGAYAADEAEVDEAGADEAPAEESAAPVAAPSDHGGFGVARDLAEGLIRPVQQNTWTPVAPPRPEPRPSTGLFEYGASIPLPDAPPRPELDPSMIVTRAPHPGAVEGS